jgi:sterol desaturase/sphingolipid hydroxylase (fatty acid hydroxylase superfamily)
MVCNLMVQPADGETFGLVQEVRSRSAGGGFRLTWTGLVPTCLRDDSRKARRMTESILAIEPTIRLVFFLGVFAIVACWEGLVPRRERAVSRWVRWPNNLGIVALNTLLLRVLIPTAAIGLAVSGEERGWGLFNALEVPYWLSVVLAVVLLDFAIYLQHVMFHAVPALWRLHRMHHADLDFDVTTGARFHPIEILLSMVLKLTVVAALGAPALAVLVFEVLLNATAMFNHANARLPGGLDRVVRWIVVTPDMHRVHHSVLPRETNSNFGFNLPWWDRLLGTYRAQPKAGHTAMTIGLAQFRRPRDLRLDRMLVQPFLGQAGGVPIDRRQSAD